MDKDELKRRSLIANPARASQVVVASSDHKLNRLNKPPNNKPETKAEVKEKKAIVNKIECGCGGVRQNCNMCYGTGYRETDGYGNEV